MEGLYCSRGLDCPDACLIPLLPEDANTSALSYGECKQLTDSDKGLMSCCHPRGSLHLCLVGTEQLAFCLYMGNSVEPSSPITLMGICDGSAIWLLTLILLSLLSSYPLIHFPLVFPQLGVCVLGTLRQGVLIIHSWFHFQHRNFHHMTRMAS